MAGALLSAVLLLVHVTSSLSATLIPAPPPFPGMDKGDRNIIKAFRAAIPNGANIFDPLLCDNIRFYCYANGKIKYIFLPDLELKGSIPPVISNISTLAGLFLQNNELNGSIPALLGKLTNLKYLHLESNRFTGYIPAFLTKMPNLIDLTVSANLLAGIVPAFPKLTTLEISNNYFSGVTRTANGSPICDKLKGNCLRALPATATSLPSDCLPYFQKKFIPCADFCNATQVGGTCGGKGVCKYKIGKPGSVCHCFPGYNDRKVKFTCRK